MKEETKRMDNRYAISNYPDAAAVTKQLDELIKLPIYTISPEALKRYEEDYFDKKCAKSISKHCAADDRGGQNGNPRRRAT